MGFPITNSFSAWSLFPAAPAPSQGTSSFPICSPGSSAVRCSWFQQSFLWTHGWLPLPLIPGLLWNHFGPSESWGMLRRSKKVTLRDLQRFWYWSKFPPCLFFLFFIWTWKSMPLLCLSPKYLARQIPDQIFLDRGNDLKHLSGGYQETVAPASTESASQEI